MHSIFVTAFILAAITIPNSANAFSCANATDEVYCAQMTGCSWSSNVCAGTFSPTCPENTCFYIFPSDDPNTGNGNPTTPFTSLIDAFIQASPTSNYTFIGLNLPNVTFALDQSIIPSSLLTQIMPYFNNHLMVIDTSQFQEVGADFVIGIDNQAQLNFNSCYIIGVQKMVLLDQFALTNATLSFYNSTINAGIIVEAINFITGTNSSILFNYSTIEDYQVPIDLSSSVSFGSTKTYYSFLLIYNTVIPNLQYSTSLISAFNVSLTLVNVTIQNCTNYQVTTSPQYLIDATSGTLAIVNSTINGFTGKFVDLTLMASFLWDNVTTTNVITTNLMRTRSEEGLSNMIIGSSFSNIIIEQNLIFAASTYGMVNSSTFTNLSYAPPSSSDYFFTHRNGICLYLMNGGQFYVMNSAFQNINSACLYSQNTPLFVLKTIFQNDDILNTSLAIPRVQSPFPGVTWIIYDYTSPQEFYASSQSQATILLTGNVFGANKLPPINGGGVFINSIWNNGILLMDNIFIDLVAEFGAAFYFTQSVDPIFQILLSAMIFFNTQVSNAGGALYINQSIPFYNYTLEQQISTCIFYSCSAGTQGGAALIKGIGSSQSQNIYHENSASYGGALYFLGQQQSIDTTNLFYYNRAAIYGGAILDFSNSFISNEIPGISTTSIDSQGLQYLYTLGPATYLFEFYDVNVNLNFLNIFDPATLVANPNYTSLFSTYTTQNISKLQLDYVPGHYFPQILKLSVLNALNEVVEYINNEIITLSMSSAVSKVFQDETHVFMNGTLFIFYKTILASPPDTTAILNFQVIPSGDQFLFQSNLNVPSGIKINFVNCQPGDVYDDVSQICKACPNNTVGITDPITKTTSCSGCPLNMICLGGDVAIPNPGYYRYDNTSLEIMECMNVQACGGGIQGDQINTQGFCNFPYNGMLCGTCAEGYAKSVDGYTCVYCDNNWMYYAKVLFKILVSLLIIFVEFKNKLGKRSQLKEAYDSKDEDLIAKARANFDSSAVLKLLISFTQMITIIQALRFDWFTAMEEFYGIPQQFIIPFINEQFSFECFFILHDIQDSSSFYLNYVFFLGQPFAILLLIVLLFAIRYCKTRKSETPFQFTANLRTAALILFYIYQPETLIETLTLFQCQEFSADQSFLIQNLNIQCYTGEYNVWAYYVGIPVLVIWGIIFPFVLFLRIRSKIQKEEDLEQRYEAITFYSFVVGGYTHESYYWEFLIIIRKLLMVVVVITLVGSTLLGQCIMLLNILLISFYLQVTVRAYENREVSGYETMSLASMIFMVFAGLYVNNMNSNNSNGSTNSGVTSSSLSTNLIIIFLSTISVLFGSFFMFNSLRFLIKSYGPRILRKIKEICSKMKKKSKKVKTQSFDISLQENVGNFSENAGKDES